MTNTELSIYDRMPPGQMIEELSKAIMMSEMFGCSNTSQGKVLALECAARRVPPMVLAERYNIIHNRLSMKADAMLADFRTKFGGSHKILANTPDEASIRLILGGEERTFTLTWDELSKETIPYSGKEASIVEKLTTGKGQLILKPKYATPRSRAQMMWARLVSDSIRRFAPEVVAGYYTPEEISDFEGGETAIEGEVVNTEEPQPEAGPEAAATPAKGVRVEGNPDASDYSQLDTEPCGEEMARKMLDAAKKLSIPMEKVKAWATRCEVERLSQIPHKEAVQLWGILRKRLTEEEFPS